MGATTSRGWEPAAHEPPFVGRIDELALIDRVLDDAVHGRPRVLTLVGPPTVGKSRLVAELLERARALGARTLVGVAHEDVQIPFLPIASALRPLRGGWFEDETDRSSDAVRSEQQRLRLFLGVTRMIIDEAARGPVVLVIEDVQWADASSAELLKHLAGAVTHEAMAAGLPFMLAVSSRPTQEGAGGQLLQRLMRDPNALNIDVGPFAQVETHAFISAVCGAHPRAEVLIDLHDATGGNPLLLGAALDRLVATGGLASVSGHLALRNGVRRAIAPTDIDREADIRASKVDGRTSELLIVAALLGDGREVSWLAEVLSAPIEASLAEAVDAGLLITTEDGRYRFPHRELRRAFERRLGHDDAERLHARIADALEAGPSSEDRAFDIAVHLSRAGPEASAERVVRWATIAGDRAAAAWAWTNATQAYTIAIDHSVAEDNTAFIDLLLKAGTAGYHTHDPTTYALLRRAADLARDACDVTRWAEAVVRLSRHSFSGTAGRLGAPADLRELEKILEELGDQHPELRARALDTMAELCFVSLDFDRGLALAEAAETELRSVGPSSAHANLNVTLGLHHLANLRLGEARARFERAAAEAESAGDAPVASGGRARAAATRFAQGDAVGARLALEAARREDGLHGFWGEYQFATATLAGVSFVQGRFGEAERLVGDALTFYRSDQYLFTPSMSYPPLALTRALRGDEAGAMRAVEDWRETGARGTWRHEALVQAWRGDIKGVRELIGQRPWAAPAGGDLFSLDAACIHVEVATVVDAPQIAVDASPFLEEAHARGVRFTLSGPWFVPRLLAECALVSGSAALASRRFDEALRLAATAAARLEEGRCRLGLARAEFALGRRERAVAHARRAVADLDAVGALSLVQQAQVLLGEIEGAVPVPVAAPRTILVTDLLDSTGLNVRVGDQRYLALLNEHDGIIRRRLRQYDGTEFQHRGDGIAAWFSSASDAVDCALQIRDDLARATVGHPELPLVARLGISAGEPLAVGGELFGLAIVETCRICDLAAPGQILVSDEVVTLAPRADFAFSSLGEFDLKGIPEKVTLYEAGAA